MDNQNVPNDDEFDEVSLPGVGDNEQPTILEVLNRGIVNTEDGNVGEPTKGEQNIGDTLNTIKVTSTLEEELKTPKNDKESDNLVSSSSSSRGQAEWNEPQRSQLVEDEENVLDFESHLIETLDNYSVSEDSDAWGVDIKELAPVEGEFLHTTSKIQTDPLIGTVFEVEPATPRVLKPVETNVPEPQRQSGLAQKAQVEKGSPEPNVKGSNAAKETSPDGVVEGSKVVDTTIPEPENELAQKANKDPQVQLDSKVEGIIDEPLTPDLKIGSSNATESVEFKEVETTIPDPQQVEVAQTLKVESPTEPQVDIEESTEELEAECTIDDTKPIRTIVKELQSEFGENSIRSTDAKAGVERRVSYPKVDFIQRLNSIDQKLEDSNEEPKTESEKQADLAGQDSEVKLVASVDRVDPIEVEGVIAQTEEPRKTIADSILDSSGSTQPIKTEDNLIAPEVKVDLVQSEGRVESTEPAEACVETAKSNESSKSKEKIVTEAQGGNIVKKSPEVQPEGFEDVATTEVENNKQIVDSGIRESLDNITQSIDATKTQIGPTTSGEQSTTGVINETYIKDTKTELEDPVTDEKESASLTLEIDQKLSELASHLTSGSKVDLNGNISKPDADLGSEDVALDVNGLPLPKTALEEEQRKQFLDSLPQISLETDSNKVAALAKREYYQSLRQYLITHSDKPPVPPETYRWEDLKRAKQRGGYPWTHLYKRPLGPDDEPEIVLLLRKSQELRFASESPKSIKKVRIDDQVSVKETERYIQELSDVEDNPTTEDEAEEGQEDARSECISCVSDSVLTVEKRASKLGKIRGILKKRSPKKELDARSLPDTSTSIPSTSLGFDHKSEEDIRERPSRPKRESQNNAKCFPIMKKLKSMADRQKKNFRNIKKISLKKDEKIALEEEQKIIKLKTSPKAERSEIPHFIEKQDSDDVLEIVELDESPSRKRKDQLELQEQAAAAESTVLVPDEIIEISKIIVNTLSEKPLTSEPVEVTKVPEKENAKEVEVEAAPPKKTARLRREHVYEDIEDTGESVSEEINNILELASVEALKQSLAKQDSSALNDVEATKTAAPLERMGSSEEEVERSHLAPLSSIDSGSEDERKPHLSPVAEESDSGVTSDKEDGEKLETVPEVIKETTEHIPWNDIELKPALKKEASPSPSEKKVTFSHVEDEAEPHREDIELPEGLSGIGPKRWSNLSDHEYEPIGEPAIEVQSQPTAEPLVSALKKEASPSPQAQEELPKVEISQASPEVTSYEASSPSKSDELKEVEELQKDIEDRYFSSAVTTPHTESRTDDEVHTSQVDSSALEELPSKPESRKKGFMASAQDRTRKMQAGLKNQAGKIKTKFRSPKKVPSGSPKAKERKRFKAPEFSKIKMPEMKRPDLSGFKRPEFTKFSKPDMSKFKLPDKFSSLKLTRSKSFKEPTEIDDTTVSGTTPESTSAPVAAPAKKQKFDFSFGTYPRAFRKKKKPQEVENIVDEPSVFPSTETQPSAESTSTPQGDRGPGPVRSRWADKFSDVSYNDSEGSRYRRYGSEQESSFDRESSMERRMKDVLDDNAKEEAELTMLGVVEQKQFADYDEENRVIHEISKTREGEFKRRPMVHQDSDLVSEEGRDIGWTEREAEKNRILRKAELEAEINLKYIHERDSNPETRSTASSKKMIFEEISADEFLLRKKGYSQEFSIGNQRFLDPHMEAGFDNTPNTLELLGSQSGSYNGSSIDRIDYGYDVPPPKPRRLSHQQRQRHYDSENASQVEEYPDDISLSQAGSDYYRHAPPSRPLRKGRFKNSQEISITGTPSAQFDDEEYADRGPILSQEDDEEKENILKDRNESPIPPPQAPRRRRKQLRDSLEKDSYVNGFGGRSVSNSYLREDNKPEEVIVYRTEHEYKIPLATPENYTDTSASPSHKSRSISRLDNDEDAHTSHGADSLGLDPAARGDNNNNANLDEEELQEKYIIEMMENDGYAIVRKENLPKPTPPARRKKFSRSPGERFATMPHLRRGSPSVGEQKSSSRNYSTIGRPTPPRRKSALSLGADSQKEFGSADFGDYEVPELDDRTESPRNLQSGDIINKMKYRPLPPPPRPPREKRHIQRDRHGDDDDELDSRDDRDDRDGGGERIAYDESTEISSDDYNLQQNVDKSIEVEVSTQTDPLPDDFVCEEFEITEDMKIIEPRRSKTLDEILKEEEEAELERAKQIDEEILVRGIQRFREANQRSISEKSRASSQAKSLSRPQTPSAILIEKRVPTPVPNSNGQTVLEASLTVQPIDDLDLEEELLRKEGLYDGSHSKSDPDSRYRDEDEAARGSEEENARIGDEEGSYTRSTDAESQQQDEEEQRLLEERFLAERLQEEKEEERRLIEELQKEQRLLEEEEEEQQILEKIRKEQRLLEEEEEEQKILEKLKKEQRLLEEEEEKQKILEKLKKEQRLLEEEEEKQKLLEKLKKEQRLRKEEEEKQKLLEELEKQQRLQEEEEEEIQRLLEDEERERILREEKEEKQRLREELERAQRLRIDSPSESERLKAEDSYEIKSEVSEEKETIPPPTSLPVSSSTQPVEEATSVLQEKKLFSEPEPTEPPRKEEPDEEPQSSPPMAPPRKRSSAAATFEDQTDSLSLTEQQPTTDAVPLTAVMPSHLTLADLEVERLRVHALQAGQIMVSNLHGAQIQADELECRSGNLVVRNIELPAGFIEDIVERVRSTDREHSQATTQIISEAKTQTAVDSTPPPPIPTRQSDVPPVRPPPPQRESVFPSEYMQPTPTAAFLQLHDPDEPPVLPRAVLPTDYHLQSGPPIGFYSPRLPDDDGEPTPPVYRRRRHHRRRDSSSEEEHQRHRSRSSRPEPQSVAQAGRQFISACSLPLANVINQLTNAVRPNNGNKQDPVQPRNISTVVVLFIVLTLSFLLYLLSGRNIHHHHWDYFNPPGNDGRLS